MIFSQGKMQLILQNQEFFDRIHTYILKAVNGKSTWDRLTERIFGDGGRALPDAIRAARNLSRKHGRCPRELQS